MSARVKMIACRVDLGYTGIFLVDRAFDISMIEDRHPGEKVVRETHVPIGNSHICLREEAA